MIRKTRTSAACVIKAALALAVFAVSTFASALTSQTITFGTLSARNYGTGSFAVGATASSGLAVAFSSTTTSVCTVSGSTVTMVATGTCTIAVNQAGNATYAATPQVKQSFTVNSGTQTITFPAIANTNFGVAPFALTASDSAGASINFASTTTSVCTVSGSTATVVGVGTCTINAGSAPLQYYNPASQVSQSFTVAKGNQSITFPALASMNLAGATQTAAATASSGLHVTYSSLTTSICTINGGGTITAVAVGTCTIAADQAGNTTYNPAPEATQSFAVLGRTQTITFSALASKVYGTSPFGLSASASSGLAVSFASTTAGVCTVSGSTVTLAGGGTCSITASQAGNSSYAAATPVVQSFTVTPASQTITFGTLPNKVYGASPFAISVSASSGLPVTFTSTTASVCTISGNTISVANVGTCTINANQAGNANFSAASQVSQSFSIVASSQSINFPTPAGSTYSATVALSANASSGLPITFSSSTAGICTVSGSNASMVGIGTCTITANQAGNAGYTAAPPVSQSFAVDKEAQAISFSYLGNSTYGATVNLVASSNSGLSVSFSTATTTVCTVSGNVATMVGLGTCTISANQAGNAIYAAAIPVNQTFTVGQASQAISFIAPTGVSYGAGPVSLNATAGSGLPVVFASSTGSVCTVSGASAAIVGAGTCTITANQAGNTNYAVAPQVSQSFMVSQANQTISFASLPSALLGQAALVLTASSSSNLAVSFVSSTTSVCTTSGANGATLTLIATGTCSVTASQAGSANYATANVVTQSFSVAADVVPTVAISNPVAGQSYSSPASITLTASATSTDAVINQVQFFNGNTLIGSATTAPYSIIWSGVQPGSYSVAAKATDSVGGIGSSAPVAITVVNPLIVALTSPSNGSTLVANSGLNLSVSVSDSLAAVSQVAFYNGASLLGTTTQAPYALVVPSINVGNYVLTAQASDSQGNTAISPIVSLTVVASGGLTAGVTNKVNDVHTDQLNTPRMCTDQSANIVWQWLNLDPFGNNLPDQDPNGTGHQFVFNFRFPGQYFDIETGTHYNYFRDYDPARGAYNQSDPLGLYAGNASTYGYVNGNPLVLSDPNGLCPMCLVIPGVCAAGGCEAIGLGLGISWGLSHQPSMPQPSNSDNGPAQASSGSSSSSTSEPSREIWFPQQPSSGWACTARADCNDNIPGNCPKDPKRRFAFGGGFDPMLGAARNAAKANATSNLQCQPKHVSCKCTSSKGDQYSGGC